MNDDIVEAVEQFTSICVDCLAYCLSTSVSDISADVRRSEGLELKVGTCRRCGRWSGTLVEPTGRLHNSLKNLPLLTVLPLTRFVLGIFANGFFEQQERRRATTEDLKKLGSAEPIAQPPQASQSSQRSDAINAEWLDAKRRLIIRLLNKLDRVHDRQETFGMRVQRLSRSGQGSSDVAMAIGSITRMRNRTVYEEYELVSEDIHRARTACLVVDTWASNLAG
jgi:hypothetical protein